MPEVSDLATKLEQATVKGIFYYPIKSCGGISVTEAAVLPTGFLHDRELVLIDPQTGKLHTQRDFHQMALIKPQIDDTHLIVDSPGQPTLRIPLIKEGAQK